MTDIRSNLISVTMYWDRELRSIFDKARRQFPAILITGPRQSGKTTFLQHELQDFASYVSFDDPLQRQFALNDPNGFLDQFRKKPVIFDEIQYVPELFSYIKIRIDNSRDKTGWWIMTGSQQFQLMKNISDSLAGRIAILELLPFNHSELKAKYRDSIQETIWYGGYPSIATNSDIRDIWIRSYIQTYIERDIRQLQQIKDLRLFETYVSLCAANHGQLLNHAQISGKCGVSQPTSKEWQSLLEASYITFTLPPYFKNFGKRLIKSHKQYFIDSALAAYLTRQPDADSLWSGAMGGSFFEGWVMSETFKMFTARGGKPYIYFWRSHDGLEVDLLIESAGKIYPVEIKQTATPAKKHCESLIKFRKLIGEESCGESVIVCSVLDIQKMPYNITALPWHKYNQWLSKIL